MLMRVIAALIFVTGASAFLLAGQGDPPRVPAVQRFDLGTMVPGKNSQATAINDRGQIVGFVQGAPAEAVAFLWTAKAGFQAILQGAMAGDINNRGEVVGTWFECVGPVGSCTGKGYIWSAQHGFRDLGGFQPVAVNDHGDMAGACSSQACVMIDGVVRPVSGASQHLAFGINNRSDAVIGPYPLFGDAFLLTRENILTRLPTTGLATASGINDSGTIAGARFVGDRLFAVTWNERTRITASVPSHGNAINNRGQVVGGLRNIDGDGDGEVPMLWDPKFGIVQLGPSLNNGFEYAVDINNRGDIVGPSRVGSGDVHVMLWRVKR